MATERSALIEEEPSLQAPDPAPEHAIHRNVTMIHGAHVVVRARRR